jgi:MFS family permease
MRGMLVLVGLLFAAGYAQYNAAMPAYATGLGGVTASAVGIAVAANAVTVVALQLFALRAVGHWRRSRAIAVTAGTWAVAWLVVLLAGTVGGGPVAVAGFALGMAVLGVGETLLSPSLMPLVNDLAPARLRGRYNGACALACTGGWMLGPLLAGTAFAAGAGRAFIVALAAVCAAAGAGALVLERRLPLAANTARSAQLSA